MRARTLLPILLAASAALTGAPWVEPAGAQVPESAIAEGLAGIRVEGEAAREAQSAFDAVEARLASAVAARTGAEAELAALAVRDADLSARIAQRTADRKAASLRLVAARRAVQEVVAGTYVSSATYDETSQLFDVSGANRVGTAQAFSRAVQEDREKVQEEARRAVEAASEDVQRSHDERTEVRARRVLVEAARQRAADEEAAAGADLVVRRAELADARAVSRVRGMDFTLVALDAYVRAAATQASCGLQWWALAGISKIEGRHGTFGGASLRPDGQVSRPIIGIPLNGTNATQAIGDTDSGALDGDTAVDRAVGPMQFIPSTWARWGRDGDGDGDRDPQNLYDATAAAAAYLCNGRSLRDDAGLRAGYFSYNQSETYVENVLAQARRYAGFSVAPAP